jgi:hypothetical protein
MEVVIVLALLGGGIWWFVGYQKRQEQEGMVADLRALAVRTKEQLRANKEDETSDLIGYVLRYCNAKRIVGVEHIIVLANCLRLMMDNSSLGGEKVLGDIDGLISRIDRKLTINLAAETAKLKEVVAEREAWLREMHPFLDVVLPLFPELEDDEEEFVGEEFVSEKTLLECAHNPWEVVEKAGRALADKRGTFITRDELPPPEAKIDRIGDPARLVHRHYKRSLLPTLLTDLKIKVRTRVPFPVRFEHTHVLGGTGHGKTQFLQSLILRDLEAALEDRGSLVVIDGQGDLIRKITRLSYFDPDVEGSLADKLILIDANDVEWPVCINMFSQDEAVMARYSPADQERIFNATISLYEYFFGALLGADLTQRQGVIFKFLARLMFVIPGATIHTLLDVMENGDDYRMYIDQLDPTSQRFFKQQFFNKAFAETKQQIATRLWGVISNGTLNRMFSNTENKFDFFEAINSGKIILINTAKDMLQADGNAILGRFFIALFARAVIQRQVLPEDTRRACFTYIDEIQDFIQNDNKIEDILNQARKYKAGLICAHQNLEQLSKEQRGTFAASTSTKFVGGLSAKDARALAGDMRTDEDFLLSAKKASQHTNFACFVKNVTSSAEMVSVPFGQMEAVETLSDDAFGRLIVQNRERYCAPPGQLSTGTSHTDASGGERGQPRPPSGLGSHELI